MLKSAPVLMRNILWTAGWNVVNDRPHLIALPDITVELIDLPSDLISPSSSFDLLMPERRLHTLSDKDFTNYLSSYITLSRSP